MVPLASTFRRAPSSAMPTPSPHCSRGLASASSSSRRSPLPDRRRLGRHSPPDLRSASARACVMLLALSLRRIGQNRGIDLADDVRRRAAGHQLSLLVLSRAGQIDADRARRHLAAAARRRLVPMTYPSIQVAAPFDRQRATVRPGLRHAVRLFPDRRRIILAAASAAFSAAPSFGWNPYTAGTAFIALLAAAVILLAAWTKTSTSTARMPTRQQNG